MIDQKGFGARLQSLRNTRGITQEELAERAELSAHYIGNLEQCVKTPSSKTIMKLCYALGTTPDYLLADSLTENMRLGLCARVSEAATLREAVAILDDMLSDLLLFADEEESELFGVPLHLIPSAPESPHTDSLTDELIRLALRSSSS